MTKALSIKKCKFKQILYDISIYNNIINNGTISKNSLTSNEINYNLYKKNLYKLYLIELNTYIKNEKHIKKRKEIKNIILKNNKNISFICKYIENNITNDKDKEYLKYIISVYSKSLDINQLLINFDNNIYDFDKCLINNLLTMKPNEIIKKLQEFSELNHISVLDACISYAKSIPWASGIIFGIDRMKIYVVHINGQLEN